MSRRWMLMLAALVAMACWGTPAALAASPEDLTISAHVDFATGESGWVEFGAFDDSGMAMPIRQLFGSPFGPSPQWTDHEDLVFTGEAGTFTIRQEVLLIDLSPSLTVGTSHWVILTGTGAYAELQGQGTGTVTIDWDAQTLDLTMVGQVQLQTM